MQTQPLVPLTVRYTLVTRTQHEEILWVQPGEVVSENSFAEFLVEGQNIEGLEILDTLTSTNGEASEGLPLMKEDTIEPIAAEEEIYVPLAVSGDSAGGEISEKEGSIPSGVVDLDKLDEG